MDELPTDPLSAEVYPHLPWRDIGISLLAAPEKRQMMAMTHHALVSEAMDSATAADRISALGIAVGAIFTGLDATDGDQLASEWRLSLADLAACGADGVWAWAATYGESTGNWWPPGSSMLARGVVNAVIRSPTVETLHASDRTSFYDSQLGAMCANWAAVSLLDPLLTADPKKWGLSHADLSHAGEAPLFSTAAEQFPAGWSIIDALGRCVKARTSSVRLELPDTGTADEARDWLALHAGQAEKIDLESSVPANAEQSHGTVRHAWSAPLPSELDHLAEVGGAATVSLTRFSRHPLHLAATLQWAARSGIRIFTPNVLIAPDRVAYRIPPVAAPAAKDPKEGQASHSESWTNPTGLAVAHAEALGISLPRAKTGRNDPCPCGSGAKYKHCHGRP